MGRGRNAAGRTLREPMGLAEARGQRHSTVEALGLGREDGLEFSQRRRVFQGEDTARAKARSDAIPSLACSSGVPETERARGQAPWVPGPASSGTRCLPEALGVPGPVQRGEEGYWEAPGEPRPPCLGQCLPHQSCCGCWPGASWVMAGAGRVLARQPLAPCPCPCQPWEPH